MLRLKYPAMQNGLRPIKFSDMQRAKAPACSLFINYFLTSFFRDEIAVGLEHFSKHIVLRHAVILALIISHK